MADFTPGPWMQKKHDGAGRTFELKREFWEVGGGPDKAGVAFVFGGQANANVVAAAPEMHYALQYVKRWLDETGLGEEVHQSVPQMINAALAKADGKAGA